MSDDFKPGTRPLLRLAGLDASRLFISRDDESLLLWAAVVALLMRVHLDPDPASRRETGPADVHVVNALRVALAENFGIEAAGHIAWALVVHGCRQKPTLASLHPWEKLMFEWQQRHASAPRIALMLRDAGVREPLPPAALEAIDGWIAHPLTALGEASAIVATLFGPRMVAFDLGDDVVEPANDALFRVLVASVLPPLAVASLRQRWCSEGRGGRWIVEYTHQGAARSFDTAANATATDVDGVIAGVDGLMAAIGRPERVFRLAPGRARDGEFALFVVADGARFAELARRLRLPLLRGAKGAGESAPAAASDDATKPASERAAASVHRAMTSSRDAADTAPASLLSLTDPPPADTQPVAESGLPSVAHAATPANLAMRVLLTSLRRSFGAGRMLQGSRWVRQSHVETPAWLKASADPIALLYSKQDMLLRKGRIVWGVLVEADQALFAPGADDRPALLVYSGDAYFDARPAELGAIGARLAALKTAPAVVPELRRFGQMIRNDSGRPLDVPVPTSLSARAVLLTSFMGIRAHLPSRVLAADWFPVLTHPSCVFPLLVPCDFWPIALRVAWDAQRLYAEPRRRTEATT